VHEAVVQILWFSDCIADAEIIIEDKKVAGA
jgi:hypothetical protein